MNSFMSITPYKEYTVKAAHLGSEPLTPTIPVFWLREHAEPQTKVILGIESQTRVLIVGTPEQIESLTALLNSITPNGSSKSSGESNPE